MDTDLIILGGGPAGLAAGMYAARARVRTILLEKGAAGGQMNSTEVVENYPGFVDPIYGAELSQRMESHARKFNLQILYEEVSGVRHAGQGFSVETESGETHRCKALILATGCQPARLGIPGEIELAGKGVSYCAVCDGPFYSDVEVAVIGGGDSAVEEAVYLTRFASKVHIVHRRDEFRAVKEIQEKAFAEPKIQMHLSEVPVQVKGTAEVQGLRLRSVKDGSESELPIAGVFFFVGLRPNTKPFKGLVKTDSAGFVLTDENMCCSVPGVFAAGDVRAKTLRQIATAVGDGALAAYSAQHYVERDR
ncbi:MAG: thioredoxin-disulfide reductase [Thermodesulfobacteriota bacterium]